MMERDPVCGMQVDPEKARDRFEHAGRTYFFCCPGCAWKFQADPQKYLTPRSETKVSSGTPLVVLGAPTSPAAPAGAPLTVMKNPTQAFDKAW